MKDQIIAFLKAHGLLIGVAVAVALTFLFLGAFLKGLVAGIGASYLFARYVYPRIRA